MGRDIAQSLQDPGIRRRTEQSSVRCLRLGLFLRFAVALSDLIRHPRDAFEHRFRAKKQQASRLISARGRGLQQRSPQTLEIREGTAGRPFS